MGAANPIMIAVASGKGGTGKTTVAVSLALSLADWTGEGSPSPVPPLFLDCDVESPNAHIFLKPDLNASEPVSILIPQVNESLCTACGKCAEVCQYFAIALLGKKVLVFPQLCHGCGSCALICPEAAISESPNPIGKLEGGPTPSGIEFRRGVLNIGEPMAVPIIRKLKRWTSPKSGQTVIIDIPPGTSCPVVEAARGADFLILVTEATPFGLHDLRMAVEVASELGLPAGVILNRFDNQEADGGYREIVESFCEEKGLPILMRIPFERKIAEGIASGKTLLEVHPEMKGEFRDMYARLLRLAGEGKGSGIPAKAINP